MNFYYPKQNRKMKKMVDNPIFPDLIAFLDEPEKNSVIHRELTANFPQKEMEIILDDAISFGLIERKNRRYSLAFPVFADADVPTEEKLILDEIAAELVKLDEISFYQILNCLWSEWFADQNYFFAVRADVDFYEKRMTGKQGLAYTDFSLEKQFKCNLADYFYVLDNELTMPELLKPMEAMIGDVNREYFFRQIQFVLDKVRKGEQDKIRESIFTNVLIDTGVINDELTEILIPQLSEENVQLPKIFQRLRFAEDNSVAIYQKHCYLAYLLLFFDGNLQVFITK